MEISNFSDMLLVEPCVYTSKKIEIPHKKIGFFDDKMLYKTIGDLKTNLDKKKYLINNFDGSNISNKIPPILEKNNKDDLFEGKGLNFIQNRFKAEVKKPKNYKINLNLIDSRDQKIKANTLNKVCVNSDKKANVDETSNSSSSKTNDMNSVLMDNKNFQVIKSKKKNNIKSDDKIKNQQINNIFKNEKANILKNQIILGQLNKDSNQDNKACEPLSFKNTLNSKMIAKRIEDSDKKSKDDTTINKRNLSVEMDQESVEFYINKFNNIANFNASIQKEIVDSKIDFIYKKIFDKKSRSLFPKTDIDDNSSQSKNKLKKKLEQENEYIKGIGNFKIKQYIEDKIQDIKRKIFFIKGVYDFSYPQIVVNKIKTGQNFYNTSHTEEKAKLRDSLNHTSKKFFAHKEEKLKLQNLEFIKSFKIEKIDTISSNNTNERFENENKPCPEIEQKMMRSSSSFNFKPLKNARLTLTNKFIHQEEINEIRMVTPLNIQTVRINLGEPSKLKVIHKSKIL